MPTRRPMALANWKMEMTVGEGLAYLEAFGAAAGDLVHRVDVVLCPPFTALYPIAQHLHAMRLPIELGAQTISAAERGAHTGEISARLAADAGARWVLLGHWEVRRHLGDSDEVVNRKVRRALEAGLRPILLVGEKRDVPRREALAAVREQLDRVLAGCGAAEAASMVVVYEPEWTIGVEEPAPAAHVTAGAGAIRGWLDERYGAAVAGAVRILYGGSVSPAHAAGLLAIDDVDGLGAGRQGRDPIGFVGIVRVTSSK